MASPPFRLLGFFAKLVHPFDGSFHRSYYFSSRRAAIDFWLTRPSEIMNRHRSVPCPKRRPVDAETWCIRAISSPSWAINGGVRASGHSPGIQSSTVARRWLEQVLRYTELLGNATTAARVGFFLEQVGPGVHAAGATRRYQARSSRLRAGMFHPKPISATPEQTSSSDPRGASHLPDR